jgi:hypothetical protein
MAGLNPNLPLDRGYTLRGTEPASVEHAYRNIVAGAAPMSFIFPRPCVWELDSANACLEPRGWRYADPARGRELAFSPIVGYEYRRVRGDVQAGDFGLIAEGGSGPVSFHLDARMFTEASDDIFRTSYDRENVDRQDESATGSLNYVSYSRYRSDLSYDWAWGRLTVARDAAHWGPAQFGNLAFQQSAVPFDQVTFTTRLGPLSVQSLYGRLDETESWAFDTTTAAKSLFAHRYELQLVPNLLLGVSEQLILYKMSAPFAFVPLVPLYIAKTDVRERLNNGNLAFDLAYRFPGRGAIYTEFLIDDMQAPTSLFSDTWSNKWAWLAGAQILFEAWGRQGGLIGEAVRIEPWVYTHYEPHTSQATNMGYPLGNPLGPDALDFTGKAYLRGSALYSSIRADLIWKGTGLGSGLHDVHPSRDYAPFRYSLGAGRPRFTLQPEASYRWRGAEAYANLAVGTAPWRAAVGAQIRY